MSLDGGQAFDVPFSLVTQNDTGSCSCPLVFLVQSSNLALSSERSFSILLNVAASTWI